MKAFFTNDALSFRDILINNFSDHRSIPLSQNIIYKLGANANRNLPRSTSACMLMVRERSSSFSYIVLRDDFGSNLSMKIVKMIKKNGFSQIRFIIVVNSMKYGVNFGSKHVRYSWKGESSGKIIRLTNVLTGNKCHSNSWKPSPEQILF